MLSYIVEGIKLLYDIKKELHEINMKLNNNTDIRHVVNRPRVRPIGGRVRR